MCSYSVDSQMFPTPAGADHLPSPRRRQQDACPLRRVTPSLVGLAIAATLVTGAARAAATVSPPGTAAAAVPPTPTTGTALPARQPVAADDPQLLALLARISPARLGGLEGSAADGAGPGGLELTEIKPLWAGDRLAGVSALLLHLRSSQPGAAAGQALGSLQRGEVNLLVAWLAEREAAALKTARSDAGSAAQDARLQTARLARQQAVLALPVDTQIALAAFRRVLEHDGDDPWSQIAVGDLLALANDQAGAATAYQTAVPLLQRQLALARAQADGSAGVRGLSHALMLAEFRTGEMHAFLEQRPAATAAYTRALALGEALLAGEPDLAERQFEVQAVSDRLAEQLTAQNQWGPALAAHQRSLALALVLAAGDPEGESTWQFYMFDKHESIADLQLATAAPELALESYRAALGLGEKLVARDRTNDAWMSGLLGLIAKVGGISTMAQTGEERRQLLLRGLELLSRVRSGEVWDNSEEWGDRLRQALNELPNPSDEDGS
jgi:tetratricopeptide (TPR) repeat protein